MIAQELEVSLHMSFVEARQKRHEFITVEHLLLALVDNPSAAEVLRACGANMEELRSNTARHLEKTPRIPPDKEVDTQPTLGFQRVIQRAILHAQSAGKKEVNGASLLVPILDEKDSVAVHLLQRHRIARIDVVNYISHGITKPAPQRPKVDVEAPAPRGSGENAALAQDLETSLQSAYARAREERHEFVTVEHLLLALLDNPAAAAVLRGCGAALEQLRSMLSRHVDEQTPRIAADREVDTEPTLGFQRVLQRAIVHVQSGVAKEVTGANVLVAIFGEKDSHAVYFLQQQGIARADVATYIAHGVVSPPPSTDDSASGDVQIILYNDEVTPMEFLATVLQEFFAMSKEDAAETMLEIYRDGKAVCGLYSQDDAEVLVRQIRQLSDQRGHPLRCEAHLAKEG